MKNISMKIMLCTTVLAFVLIWPPAAISDEDPPEKSANTHYDEGTEYLRKGDFSSAITSFTSAINLLKDKTSAEEIEVCAEAYNNRGLAYYETDDYANAESDFNASYVKSAANTKALSNLALVYFVQNRYSDARDKYVQALPAPYSADEKLYHADVYNNLGVCYAKIGEKANAIDAYSNAIRISKWEYRSDDTVADKSYTDAYYNRGNLYYNDGKYDLAILDYTVAIDFYKDAEQLEPGGVLEKAYHNRALCFYNKGMYQQAINDYEKALEVNPNYAWAHYGKGFAHFMSNENNQAIAEYEAILGSEIDHWARFGLGLAWCRKGDIPKGLAYLNESCNSGQCPDACDTIEQNRYADPGTIMNFQLPQ